MAHRPASGDLTVKVFGPAICVVVPLGYVNDMFFIKKALMWEVYNDASME
jgi:hypothetical protein